jgi:hypothetical protein
VRTKRIGIDKRLKRHVFASLGRSFYGGIYENCASAPMGKGHNNSNLPFDLTTAEYIRPILEAIEREGTRKVVIKAGVKTLKSFVVEIAAAHHLCHSIGDVTIYFGTGQQADDQSTTRIVAYFEGISSYQAKAELVTDRFDYTQSAIKFPDKTFRIRPANLANTQGVNLGFVGICDAFITERSGMIDQAIARTTQYPDDKKIIIESQASEEGFDFERHYDDTDQRELHVLCPCCGQPNIWSWKGWYRQRPDDFKACAPLSIPSLDRDAWVEHHTPLLLAHDRRDCGFKRGDEAAVKLPDGEYNEAEVLRQTYYECYHCGSAWRDDGRNGATRIALDKSAYYVPARTTALLGNIGFNIPQWINRRLPWGDMMLEYLKQLKTYKELGNTDPIKLWWQKTAARTWSEDLSRKAPERIGASIYDSTEKIPGELGRIAAVDFQFNGTHMPYQCWAIGDGRSPRLLHWEWIKPITAGLSDHQAREFCKVRVRELNKQFCVEEQNCMIDAGHRPDLVREWAAEDAKFSKIKVGNRIREKWITYGLLVGDDRMSYRWQHPGRPNTLERFKVYDWVNVGTVRDGKRIVVPVHHRLWSNTSIKDICVRWRDGDGAPKIEVSEQFLRDTSKEGFWAQMTSERKMPWRGRPGKERYENEGRPNHGFDCFAMMMVRLDELGLLNSFSPPAEDTGD